MTSITENDILSAFRLVKENQNKIMALNTEVKFNDLIENLERVFISSDSKDKDEEINNNRQLLVSLMEEIKVLYKNLQEDTNIKATELIIEVDNLFSCTIDKY